VAITLTKNLAVESKNVFVDYNDEIYLQPEQIHLSLGADETEMTGTWLTRNKRNATVVEFGPKSDFGVRLTRRTSGNMSLYKDFGSESRKMYIYRVTLKKLTPGIVYCCPLQKYSAGHSPIWPGAGAWKELGYTSCSRINLAVHYEIVQKGSEEELTPCGPDPLGASALHTSDSYTYSRVHVVNKTHIDFEQVAVP
ncbi:iron/zinc purple acid phosphatase protein-like, partial [Tropilaelaps mercedesae]